MTVIPRDTLSTASAALAAVADHDELHVARGARSGVPCVVALHRTIDGHALGGCRIWRYTTLDDAVVDAARLSRAMTLKAAAADLPVGGGKGVIALPPDGVDDEQRTAALQDFAELVERLGGRYLSGQDVGASADDMRELARWTSHVGGLPQDLGGSGDPSVPTAEGVLVAVLATVRYRLGAEQLSGCRVRLVGLGSVGSKVARHLLAAGVELEATDLDPSTRPALEQAGGRWIEPERALEGEADVLCPCALGGVLDERVAATLRVQAIAGAANNQLTAPEVADRLAARGILWAPDFIVNGGGLMNIADELEGHDPTRVAGRIAGIADTLATVFARADRDGVSTLAAAHELAAERLLARGARP